MKTVKIILTHLLIASTLLSIGASYAGFFQEKSICQTDPASCQRG